MNNALLHSPFRHGMLLCLLLALRVGLGLSLESLNLAWDPLLQPIAWGVPLLVLFFFTPYGDAPFSRSLAFFLVAAFGILQVLDCFLVFGRASLVLMAVDLALAGACFLGVRHWARNMPPREQETPTVRRLELGLTSLALGLLLASVVAGLAFRALYPNVEEMEIGPAADLLFFYAATAFLVMGYLFHCRKEQDGLRLYRMDYLPLWIFVMAGNMVGAWLLLFFYQAMLTLVSDAEDVASLYPVPLLAARALIVLIPPALVMVVAYDVQKRIVLRRTDKESS